MFQVSGATSCTFIIGFWGEKELDRDLLATQRLEESVTPRCQVMNAEAYGGAFDSCQHCGQVFLIQPLIA